MSIERIQFYLQELIFFPSKCAENVHSITTQSSTYTHLYFVYIWIWTEKRKIIIPIEDSMSRFALSIVNRL